MNQTHQFKCASCNTTFPTDKRASRCPTCGCKTLIHISGPRLKGKTCTGSCQGCSGCS